MKINHLFRCSIVLLIAITGCGFVSPDDSQPVESIGTSEGELNIIAWEGYVERGENDVRFDWVSDFELDSGCKVNVTTASSSDEMLALMNQGGYDLVAAAGDAADRLIADGRVQALSIELLPSWDSIDPRFKESPWHTVDGIHYGVPFLWSANRVLYSKSVFQEPPVSNSVVYEEQILPDGLTNSNRVQAYEGAMAIADAALFLMQNRPELGIRDPYELDRDQFGEAVNLLRRQRDLVSSYWTDAPDQLNTFLAEGNAVSIAWPYTVKMMQKQGLPVLSVISAEGATGRADAFMLSSDAPHPNCAYRWMEHILDPQAQGDAAAWTGTNPSVAAACETSNLLSEGGCGQNGFHNLDNIYFWKTPNQECGDGRSECVPYSDWVTAYISVIGGQ